MEQNQLKKLYDIKIKQLVKEKWDFLHNGFFCFFVNLLTFTDYPLIEKKYFHRSQFKDIAGMDKLKEHVFHKLGYTPIHCFLQQYGKLGDHPNCFRNVEKGCCNM